MKQKLAFKDIGDFSSAFDADSKNTLALNAVAKSGIAAVALNRNAVSQVDHTYSDLIETPEATDQKRSGRCWLFAGLNTLRLAVIKKLKLEKFELSQAHLMFWDKLEKANYFLENIIETRNEPLNSRLVMWLLHDPMSDGGQWHMFVNLVTKYGVVPKTAMPETFSSSESGPMNGVLLAKLREYAKQIRDMHKQNASVSDMRVAKRDMLSEFYRILSIHLGKPPEKFIWEWRDKNKKFTRRGTITPQTFFKDYVAINLDDMVCPVHAPTKDKPFHKMYTVQYLGNVVGGQIVLYLNVPMRILKKAVADSIVDGNAVWFGCDVGKMLERDMGILDAELFNYEVVYGTRFQLDKAARLDYGHSRMTHAMVLTGVDLDNAGKPIKWRVENSWGTDKGDKGYMVMSDKWFDEFLYEVTVSKKYLTPDLIRVLDTPPIVLPPWDPLGALAHD